MGRAHLDDALESHWYRIVHPGAGGPSGDTAHGWYLLPEVDDEVLVAFPSGNPSVGYVLGGLYNGKDQPPIDTLGSGNKVDKHVFYTKTGAFLLFDDKSGADFISRWMSASVIGWFRLAGQLPNARHASV